MDLASSLLCKETILARMERATSAAWPPRNYYKPFMPDGQQRIYIGIKAQYGINGSLLSLLSLSCKACAGKKGKSNMKRRPRGRLLEIRICAAVISPNLSHNCNGYRGDRCQKKCVQNPDLSHYYCLLNMKEACRIQIFSDTDARNPDLPLSLSAVVTTRASVTFSLWLGFVNLECASTNFLAVHGFFGFLCIRLLGEFDKPKSS